MRIGLLNHQRLHLPRDGRPASSGSIGHWHFEVATRLAAGGDEVLVVGPKGGRLEVREQEYAGVRFVDLPDGLDELAERLRATLRPGRSDLCADTSHALFARRAARLLAREGVDAVVVTNRSQYLRPLRRRLPDARLVLHMQCEWLTQLERSRIVPRLALADRVTACSRYLTERIATAFPEYAARCGVVHNGVDLERFQPGSGDGAARLGPRLVFSGRLSPEKGVHHLVEAFARVVRDLPDARLELVGPKSAAPFGLVVGVADDPGTRALERFYRGTTPYLDACFAGLDDEARARVEVTGNVDQQALAERLRRADLAVLPSVWPEPFGMAALEAMACGLPVVASDGGGLSEFATHGQDAWLVQRASTDRLEEGVRALLDDRALARTLGRAGRETARAFGWEQVTARLREELER